MATKPVGLEGEGQGRVGLVQVDIHFAQCDALPFKYGQQNLPAPEWEVCLLGSSHTKPHPIYNPSCFSPSQWKRETPTESHTGTQTHRCVLTHTPARVYTQATAPMPLHTDICTLGQTLSQALAQPGTGPCIQGWNTYIGAQALTRFLTLVCAPHGWVCPQAGDTLTGHHTDTQSALQKAEPAPRPLLPSGPPSPTPATSSSWLVRSRSQCPHSGQISG